MSTGTGRTLPDRIYARIYAVASPLSPGGSSLMRSGDLSSVHTVAAFASGPEVIQQAVLMLETAGFEVQHVSALMISICAPPAIFERAFSVCLTMSASGDLVHAEGDPSGLIATEGTRFDGIVEDVAIERRVRPMQPTTWPPSTPDGALRVPSDLSAVLVADRAHRAGITGANVRVALVDTGFYNHPFFEARGYRVAEVVLAPGARGAQADEAGHGTAMAAALLAVAPDAEVYPIKIAQSEEGALLNPLTAFNLALDVDADVICCPWGFDLEEGPLAASDRALTAAISAAVAIGKTVVFPSGNGQANLPGQHPEVVSAGGAVPDPEGGWRASDLTSGFVSKIFEGRQVPDLCGAAGPAPDGALLVLPTSLEGTTGRGLTRGWCVAGGGSAAAAQIAGAAAVVLQARPGLAPDGVKDILVRTARDVTKGQGPERFGAAEAGPGPDLPTGFGVVDVVAAAMLAAVWQGGEKAADQAGAAMLPGPRDDFGGPVPQPFQPFLPFQPPFRPFRPVLPFRPLVPFRPLLPFRPLVPFQPFRPVLPFRPLVPFRPVLPFRPLVPF